MASVRAYHEVELPILEAIDLKILRGEEVPEEVGVPISGDVPVETYVELLEGLLR